MGFYEGLEEAKKTLPPGRMGGGGFVEVTVELTLEE